ncbi:MAG: glycoside hydrolase family 2, partial [Solobacterium sp.]|nr:glycoside hydrolase family 2 [Solobacterium sp.]
DEILNTLYNSVCIFAWVAFNEGWGQFDSEKATAYIKRYDTTRLVDSASGWFDQGAGDFLSRHCYILPFWMPKDDGRIILLSEFGGYSFLEKGHSKVEKLYGYRKYTDKGTLVKAIENLYRTMIDANIAKGLSGCIYTQVSDVEDECNGLFTYDRQVMKIDQRMMKRINDKLKRRVK